MGFPLSNDDGLPLFGVAKNTDDGLPVFKPQQQGKVKTFSDQTLKLSDIPAQKQQSNEHSDSWKKMQADMAKKATDAGLPYFDNGNDRLNDAIQRSEKAGYKFNHFTNNNDPTGDRTVTIDIENLTKALQKRLSNEKNPTTKASILKELRYWQDELKGGMTAEEWKKQTGQDDPIPQPSTDFDKLNAQHGKLAPSTEQNIASSGHEEVMQEQVDKRNEAIDNSLQRKYQQQGKTVSKNSAQYRNDFNDILNKIHSGDMVQVPAKDGKMFVVKSEGFLPSMGKSFVESFKAPIEGFKIMNMDGKELADYLDKKSQEQPYLEEGAPSPFLGQLGMAAGGFPKVAGEFAINEAVPYLGTAIATADAEISASGNKTAELYQKNLNAITGGQREPTQEERIEAANKAKKDAPITAAPEAIMTMALGEMGADTKGLKDAANSFKQTVLKSGKSIGKFGAYGGAAGATETGIEKAQGYNVTMQDAIDNFGKEGFTYATMDAMFKLAPLVAKMPTAMKAAWNNFMSKVPEQMRSENLPPEINKEINDYSKASKSVPDHYSDDQKISLSHLIKKKNELKENADENFKEDNQSQTEAIDKNINAIKLNPDNALDLIPDEHTGESNANGKKFEGLSKQEKDGIVVQKDYGDAEAEEVGQGEEKRYKPKAYYYENKGDNFKIKHEIEVGDKTYSDKSQAQEVADKALKKHYYENGMHEFEKPQRKSANTPTEAQPKEEESIIQQQGVEGNKAGNENANEENKINKNNNGTTETIEPNQQNSATREGVESEKTEQENVGEVVQPTENNEQSYTNEGKIISTPNAIMHGSYGNEIVVGKYRIKLPEKGYFISNVELNNEGEKGKGYGQDIYIKALIENGRIYSTDFWFKQSEDALRVQEKLKEKGLATIKEQKIDGIDFRVIEPTEKLLAETQSTVVSSDKDNSIVGNENKVEPQKSNASVLGSDVENDKGYLNVDDITKIENGKSIFSKIYKERKSGDVFRGVEYGKLIPDNVFFVSENPLVARDYTRAENTSGKFGRVDDKYNKDAKFQRYSLDKNAKILDAKTIEGVNELRKILGLEPVNKFDGGAFKVYHLLDGISKDDADKIRNSGYDAVRLYESDRDTGFSSVDGDSIAILNKDILKENSLKPQKENKKQTNSIVANENNSVREKQTEQNTEQELPKETKKEEQVTPTPSEETPPMTGIKHAATEERRKEFGLGEYERNNATDAELQAQADEAIKKGYNIENLVQKLEDKIPPTGVENFILKKYLSGLEADFRKTKSEKTLAEAQRVYDALDKIGSLQSEAFRTRKGLEPTDDTMLGFFTNERAVNNDAPLTENQKKVATEDFNRFQEAKAQFDKEIQKLKEEFAQFKAEQEAAKLQKTSKKSERKTHEERVAYRKSEVEKAREALKKLRHDDKLQSGIPFEKQVRELIAIAPHVKNVLADLLEEGALKLADAIDKVYEEFKEFGVSKTDIHNIIAGEYKEKKITKKEAAIGMENLRIEAQLLNKYEALLKGEQPKNEKALIKRNQQIHELREKIKGFHAEGREAISDENMLKRQSDRIEEIKARIEQLENGVKSIRAEKKESNDIPEIAELKKQLKEAETKFNETVATEKRINGLEQELERLQQRKPKDEKDIKHREISEKEKQLKEQIAEERKKIREEEREANAFYKEDVPAELKKLQALKKRNETEANKIREKIKKGDFAPEEKKTPILEDREFQKRFPNAFKAAQKSQDELIKVKHDIAIRRAKQMYENKTPQEKAIEIFSKTLNIPRTLMASMDFSAPLRQAVIATTAHPILANKALQFMFKAAADEKVYNRWLDEVHSSDRWKVAEKIKLAITDPESLHVKEQEEAFQGAPYAEKIPIVGAGVKASERAYVGYLNKLRWDLFNMYADRFEEMGKTYDNNPKLYEGLSSFINSATGRGNMKGLEAASPILNWVLFASKLIASRLNMLGLSDIPNLAVRGATLGKYGLDYGFYSKLPKELRIEAGKDMAKFVATGIATLLIAKGLSNAVGGNIEIETDPRSSDFGKIKIGNTRWDIWGGFQPYARVITQSLMGQRKATTTGKMYELDGKSAFGENRLSPLSTFARQKLSPVVGGVIDLASGRDAAGQPVTLGSKALSFVTPLIINDVYQGMKEQGIKALFTVGIPSAFGVGVQTYAPRPPKAEKKKSSNHSVNHSHSSNHTIKH